MRFCSPTKNFYPSKVKMYSGYITQILCDKTEDVGKQSTVSPDKQIPATTHLLIVNQYMVFI